MKRILSAWIRMDLRQWMSVLLTELLLIQLAGGPALSQQPDRVARKPIQFAAAAQASAAQQAFTAASAGSINAVTPADISVAYADDQGTAVNFPVPWQGAPNVLFLGGGTPVNAGVIRIDNPTGAPLSIDKVTVDLQRPGPVFDLWGSFTIPAQGSAILTQTAPGNFNTSDFPIVPCGGTVPAGDTRIPKITITIAGAATSYLDAAHVLDTGGFDLSCRGNESLGWRRLAPPVSTGRTGN